MSNLQVTEETQVVQTIDDNNTASDRIRAEKAADDSDKRASDAEVIKINNDIELQQLQDALNEALNQSDVDPNYISYTVGTKPDSSGATSDTIGAYFKTGGIFQKVQWDSNSVQWIEIGDTIRTGNIQSGDAGKIERVKDDESGWEMVELPVIDARWFGLITESSGFDSAASNVEAVESAIDYLESIGGGYLDLPAGRIPLSRRPEIIEKTGIKVRGAGRGSTTLAKDPSNNTSFYWLFQDCEDVGIEHVGIDGQSENDKTPSWSQIRFTNCDGWYAERINATHCHYGVVGGRDGSQNFSVSDIIALDSPNAIVSLIYNKNGNIKNVTGYNCWELVDFGGDPRGLNENMEISNCHGDGDGLIEEEAFDLGGVKNVTIENCTARNYLDGVLAKTEPVSAESIPWGKITLKNCDFEVHRRGVFAAMYSDTDGLGEQGPMILENITGSVIAGSTLAEEFIRYDAVAGETGNTKGAGLKIDNCHSDGFPHFLYAGGLANNVRIRHSSGKGLESAIDTTNLGGAAGRPIGWVIDHLEIDAGLLVDSSLESLEIDNIEVIAGPNNIESVGIQTRQTEKVTIRNYRIENFEGGGIRVDHFAPSAINENNYQGITIKSGILRNVYTSSDGFNRSAITISFAGRGQAGEVIKGIIIDGAHVYSDSGNMQHAVEFDKGDYDNISGVFIDKLISDGHTGAVIKGESYLTKKDVSLIEI